MNKKGNLARILGVLQIVFITLKLTDNLNWNWFWVLSPTILPLCLIIALTLLLTIIYTIGIGLGILNVEEFTKKFKENNE